MNKKEKQAYYILGMLGYSFDEVDNASKLLEENEFKDIVNFENELGLYNIENQTCSKISLAGVYPSLKLKDASNKDIERLMMKCNVSISV